MKDQLEAKLYLFAIPALLVWELLYQLVIVRLFPAAAGSSIVHGGGFVLLAAAGWFIGKRIQAKREERTEEEGE